MTFTQFRAQGHSVRVAFFAVRYFKGIESLNDMRDRYNITQSEFYQILGMMR